jgi:hypothetical protein
VEEGDLAADHQASFIEEQIRFQWGRGNGWYAELANRTRPPVRQLVPRAARRSRAHARVIE